MAATAADIFPTGNAADDTATIQAAIDAAANLEEPGIVTLGAGLFEIDSQLMVTGGVTLAGQGWENTVIKQTVATNVADNSLASRVVTVSGGAKVEHVTLTGGRVMGENYQFGGGAYVDGGTLSWCCITNNSVTGANVKFGGGVGFNQGAGGLVDHCIIADNLVKTTTGAELGGGGIGAYLPYGAITVDSCLVSGNRAVVTYNGGAPGVGKGGGIGINFVYRNVPVIVRNTTIAGNVAGEDGEVSLGGGVYTSTDTQKKLTMLNCIVADNATAGTNTAMAIDYAGGVDYCLFDVEADKAGEHSLYGGPAFVDAAEDDYRLTLDSPAVGSGEAYDGIGSDLNGADFSNPPSIGCYEYGELAAKPAFDVASGTVFYPPTNVTLTCATDGAVIYYTVDGSRPTEASMRYTGPIEISATMTIKARAYAPGVGPSAIATVTVVNGEGPEAPEPISIAIVGSTVKVGVSNVSADCWYALKKTTDLSLEFTVVDSTWTKGSELLAGTSELEIALGDGEPRAFYRIVVSTAEP